MARFQSGPAGPGRVSINNSEEVSSEEVSGVLEAQVPSVPKSHLKGAATAHKQREPLLRRAGGFLEKFAFFQIPGRVLAMSCLVSCVS